MPKFRVNVTVKHKGNIFEKSATKAAAARMVIKINEALAQEAVNRIKNRLGQVLRNPTGYYESNITIERRSTYRGVTDSGVPYGGWLEGIDPRNSTSRFKGYNTFRIVQESMKKDKERIAQPHVTDFVHKLSQ